MNQQTKEIYLDYNATTPCDPRVVETMLPWFYENPGNAASRTHAIGWKAEEAVKTLENKSQTLSKLKTTKSFSHREQRSQTTSLPKAFTKVINQKVIISLR